jgi:hypothetical protein
MRTISLPRAALVLCVLAFFLSISNISGHAQTAGAGTISGTITDASHSVVSGATVTVTNAETGVAHTFVTNPEGIYVAPFLQPGHYTVEVSASGFGKVSATNLTLLVGQTVAIDLSLTVQSASATVEVTSESPLLDT